MAARPQADLQITEGNRRRIRDTLAEEAAVELLHFLNTYTVRTADQDLQNHDHDHNQEENLGGGAAGGSTRVRNNPLQHNIPLYVKQLENLKQKTTSTLYVDFQHIKESNDVLADILQHQFYRLDPFFRRALFDFIKQHIPSETVDAAGERRFWLSIYHLPDVHNLRHLRSSAIGALSSFRATVTRTSEVRPELLSASFRCKNCGNSVADVEQQFRYTEPKPCGTCGARDEWELLPELSSFVDWQKVRVQENATEIPPGSMPRTIDVILRNDLVEMAKAGDRCVFTGTLVVIPEPATLASLGEKVEAVDTNMKPAGVTGAREFGTRELFYRTCFLAYHVESLDGRNSIDEMDYDDEDAQEAVLQSLTPAQRARLSEMRDTPRLYEKLVTSVAPTIAGHKQIKAGILLQLFGGVHKHTGEGISLRGDINVCLVGDPSCAKSQFLKYVVDFMPRSVYTSGRASSAAGLTASVGRDPETGEFCIEAGALMLADNGVCCIDEFDKMDDRDQVAIHEAMEQQTISISKAGLNATLNARTSILAAANPIGGRYDRSKTLRQNLQMTAPIMSRFDLFFIILDELNAEVDEEIARFIINVHKDTPGAVNPEFSQDELQSYIKYARTLNPKISPDSRNLLVQYYKELRQNDEGGVGRSSYRITVRQLESLIRLSEALARVHLEKSIRPKHVREAARLLNASIIRIVDEEIDFNDDEEEFQRLTGTGEMQGSEEEEASGATTQPPAAPVDEDRNTEPATTDAPAETTTTAGPVANKEERKQFRMGYREFRALTARVVIWLRSLEHDDKDGNHYEGSATLNQIVAHLLEDKTMDERHGTDDEEKERLRAAVKHMINKTHVLIEIPGQIDDNVAVDERLLAVHPNFILQ